MNRIVSVARVLDSINTDSRCVQTGISTCLMSNKIDANEASLFWLNIDTLLNLVLVDAIMLLAAALINVVTASFTALI